MGARRRTLEPAATTRLVAELEAGVDLRAVHHLAHPPLDRTQRQPELRPDGGVRQAGEQQGEHLGVQGLEAIEQELTAEDGFYAGKLDTDKRNVLVSQVLGRKDQGWHRGRDLPIGLAHLEPGFQLLLESNDETSMTNGEGVHFDNFVVYAWR